MSTLILEISEANVIILTMIRNALLQKILSSIESTYACLSKLGKVLLTGVDTVTHNPTVEWDFIGFPNNHTVEWHFDTKMYGHG